MNEYGLKGQFGTPETLTIDGVAVKVVIEGYTNGSSHEKAEGRNHQGAVVGVTTYNETHAISVNGWLKADYTDDILPSGKAFVITDGDTERYCICESFEITKSNTDIARFTLSATQYPLITAPVTP